MPEKPKKSFLAGCDVGCIVVVICVCVIAGWAYFTCYGGCG